MRLAPLLIVAALAGGCGWDGPNADVRVVDPTLPRDETGAVDIDAGPRVDDALPGVARTGDGDAPDTDAAGAVGGVGGLGDASAAVVPETIAVVGDSLTVSAEDELVEELTRRGFRVVAVDAMESRRMASGSDDLPSGVRAIEGVLDAVAPDLWVVALGTNDVGAQVGAEGFRADLRETLAALPPDAPVVWVDVWIRDRAEDSLTANEVIRHEVTTRSTASSVVDWFTHGTDDGVITGDGVHLTDEGQRVFARSIADRIDAMYRR